MVDFTLAIIAGGKSSRMGTDKSFVVVASKPLIAHVVERVSGLGQIATILITNKPDAYAHLNLPMYGDVLPDKGSLGGIYTAIHHSQTDYTLTVPCDTPFIQPALLRYMLMLQASEGSPFDVVVPRVENYPQGLHALYSKACLDPMRERIDANRLNVIGFYPQVRVRYIDETEYQRFDPKGLTFFNINTPNELAQAQQIAVEE
ncbi:MAG: molybdenum cofactor guanylyltransferase [Anaerolineae bacterium]|nr:molybdenum cofactor guanylyltransferase [Anaerolineae bacterium]